MPIVTVSHKDAAPAGVLKSLRASLPTIVAEAVGSVEEPYDGRLKRGDINMRFLPALSTDEALDYVVEIRTTWTDSRSANLEERVARIRRELSESGLENFGVWIEIPPAAWDQD